MSFHLGYNEDMHAPHKLHNALPRLLIILGLSAFIFLPRPLLGWYFLQKAPVFESAGNFKQASIAYYDSPFIHYVIIVFMFLAGTNFVLHYHALHGNFKIALKNDEFKFYISVIGVIILFVTAGLMLENYGTIEKTFRDTAFQVVSMTTTTGYVTAD